MKNYEIREKRECTFVDTYNRETKTARTFIDVNYGVNIDNCNCQNSFDYSSPDIHSSIYLQINDKKHWEQFKSSILENSEFIEVYKSFDEIQVRYGIEKSISNEGHPKGTFISYTEHDKYTTVYFSFDRYL